MSSMMACLVARNSILLGSFVLETDKTTMCGAGTASLHTQLKTSLKGVQKCEGILGVGGLLCGCSLGNS